jgi:hypothetical protein
VSPGRRARARRGQGFDKGRGLALGVKDQAGGQARKAPGVISGDAHLNDIVPTMSAGTVITVTWMDGKEEVYHDAASHDIADGVLTIQVVTPVHVSIRERQPASLKTVRLPLANIREITVEQGSQL